MFQPLFEKKGYSSEQEPLECLFLWIYNLAGKIVIERISTQIISYSHRWYKEAALDDLTVYYREI